MTKDIKRNIKVLSIFNFLLDFRLYGPFMIVYIAEICGSYTLGMSIFAVATISSAIFEVPTGVFSDRIGRRKTVFFGAIGSFLSVLFYALGMNYWVLFLGAICEGWARSLFSGNNDALLHDTVNQMGQVDKFKNYLGKTGSMFQFALALGAILGSIGVYFGNLRLVFAISVIPQFLNIIVSLVFIEPKIHTKKEGNIYKDTWKACKYFIKNKRLRYLSLGSIFSHAFGETTFQFRAAFIDGVWPTWAIGILRIFSHLGSAVSYLFSGKLIGKFKELKILITSILYSRLTYLLVLVLPNSLKPIPFPINSLGHGVNQVAKSNLLQKEFNSEQRATMASLNSLAGSLMFGLVSIGLGYVGDLIGAFYALMLLQVLSLIVIFFYYRAFKH